MDCVLVSNTDRVHSRRKNAPFSARAAIGDATDGPSNEGNPALQDSLVSMVRLQIGQEKVKESVEVERQKLQELADEVSTVGAILMGFVCSSYLGSMPCRKERIWLQLSNH